MNIKTRQRGFNPDNQYCSILGAVLGGAAAGIAGSLFGGSKSDSGASDATREQRRQYDLTRKDMKPWMTAGQNALGDYQNALGQQTPMYGAFAAPAGSDLPTYQSGAGQLQYQNLAGAPPTYQNLAGAPPEYQATGGYGAFGQGDRFNWDTNALLNDPGYQFTRDQALQGTERAENALGNQNSGGILTALQDRAGGVAAQYGQDFRRTAAAENAMNYGRDVGEYGMGVARNQDIYNRNTQDYGIQSARNQDIYGRGLQDYGVQAARNQDIYGRGVQDYGINAGRNTEMYNRGISDYGIGTDRANALYGRGAQEYGFDVGRNTDQYGRDQNYLSRLSDLSSGGQNAAAQLGGFGANTASNIGNIAMQNAANQTQMAQGVNNAIQGSISNYLTHDLYSNNPNMLYSNSYASAPGGGRIGQGGIFQ